MKNLLSCLLLLSAVWPWSANAAGDARAPEAASKSRLDIVTLNLYHDKDDWPKRRIQIVEKLKALRPDVIALQEVLQHETLPNQARWLAEQLGYEWFFVSTDPPGQVHRYGNALLSRRPILARAQRALQPLDDSRSAGLLRIDLNGHAVDVYVTHLHWTDQGGPIRARQLADLIQFIDATSREFPVVVAGDFNATADAPELAALRSGFVDAYGLQHPQADRVSSSTLNLHYFAPKRIDHVFFQRKDFTPLASEIILNHADAQGVWASDHYGMHVSLQLKPAESQAQSAPP